VFAKLKAAQAAAALDPVYARNTKAIRAVQPEDLLLGDISARLGSIQKLHPYLTTICQRCQRRSLA
jgi:N12 class adenine-specific DNA methylase